MDIGVLTEAVRKKLNVLKGAKTYWILVLDLKNPENLRGLNSESIDEIMKKYDDCLAKYIFNGDSINERYSIAFFKKENNEYKLKTVNQLD